MRDLDHLVYTVPDLDRGVATLAGTLGITATPGGRHEGFGTRNALIALADEAYLEVIGPDPEGPPPDRERPFGLDRRPSPGFATWAAKAVDLETRAALARDAGLDPGPVSTMSRTRADGTRLQWKLTDIDRHHESGLVPFLIDWGSSPHPAADAARGVTLVQLHAEHPRPARVLGALRALGVTLAVEPGPRAALVATLDTPKGRVQLR